VTLDLVILIAVLVFAILGAITGAAKQIAQNIALIVAGIAAKVLGTAIAPQTARFLQGPPLLGTLVATVVIFLLVFVALRYVLTQALRRLLDGKDPGIRSFDRTLGFAMGGLKVATLWYVLLCAVAFASEHVVIAGRKLGLTAKDSVAYQLAHQYNLFEYTQSPGVKDLLAVAQANQNPGVSRKLKEDPAFKSLEKDARFRKALSDPGVLRAMKTGDYRPLLDNTAILQLVQDPVSAARLAAAAAAAQREMADHADNMEQE